MTLHTHFFRLVWALILSLPISIYAQGSGNTLVFNGSNESINIGNQVANETRSIEMWFKLDQAITSSLSTPIALIARDFDDGNSASTDEFAIAFYPVSWGNGGSLTFLKTDGSTKRIIHSDQNNWEPNRWYHVAAVVDPSTGMKLYINGMLQQSTHPSTSVIGTQNNYVTDDVHIGRWGYKNYRHFKGEIDEVRLWTTARSTSDIRNKMCSKLIGNEPGLRAYYNFDSQSTQSLIDLSGNNFNGSFVNLNGTNRIYSGAPIGDQSANIYSTNGTSAQSVTIYSPQGNSLEAFNFNTNGAHVYLVNQNPNALPNSTNVLSNEYFGVFLTDAPSSFDIEYSFVGITGNCSRLFTRNDNSDMNWVAMNETPINGVYNSFSQSNIGDNYRAEYLISNDANITLDLGADTALYLGQSLTLDALNPNATYLWQDGSTNPTLTINQTGQYWVEVTIDECTVADSIYVTFSKSLNLRSVMVIEQNISVFPNPCSDYVNIQWSEGRANVLLIEMSGRVVNFGGFDQQAIIDLSAISSGAYILQVSHDSGAISRAKIIVN